MKREHYSYSSISQFSKCPKAFYYKYVKEAEPLFPTTIEAHIGTAVHAGIAHVYQRKLDGYKVVKFSRLKRLYDEAWHSENVAEVKIVKTEWDAEHYYQVGLAMLKKWFSTVFQQDDGETLAVEQEFEMTLSNGSLFTGFIDRMSRDEDGILRITDYKTGSRLPDPKEELQLRAYGLHVLHAEDEKRLELEYYGLKTSRSRTAVLRRKNCRGIDKELTKRIREIENAKRYVPKPSGLCGWCSYQHICPAKR